MIGETLPETEPVFRSHFAKVNGENSPELVFADKAVPSMWYMKDEILKSMDLRGEYQEKNLRTVLAAVDVLRNVISSASLKDNSLVAKAIADTARRMDFHGRWERLFTNPDVICDIGHNAAALKYNFAQLEKPLPTVHIPH